jgi:pilus assembly protein Flp/PilA
LHFPASFALGKLGESDMLDRLARFRRDESGAAMVEYSVLIGIITAAVLASVAVVGTYVETAWSNLTTALG